MSLFFGDFPTEDTLAPLVMVDHHGMLFACPACGACVVELQFSEANRRLHEVWHVEFEQRIEQLRQMYKFAIDRQVGEMRERLEHPDVPRRDYEQFYGVSKPEGDPPT